MLEGTAKEASIEEKRRKGGEGRGEEGKRKGTRGKGKRKGAKREAREGNDTRKES